MKKTILFYFLLFVFSLINAQNSATNSGGQVVTSQPKIMVVPYVKENENIRKILEDDVNKRIVLTKIKEAFDSRGFTTVDFIQKLEAKNTNDQMKFHQKENQSDLISELIQQSGADIYVIAEISINKSQSGNSVKLILTGNEISTGNSLSNKVGDSGKFYTDDYGSLATRAVESIADDFLDIMQNKFNDIINNGKSIIVDISFDSGSSHNMESTDIGNSGLPLSDQIEEWMEKNAFKNNYHIQGTTTLSMVFDDVRIPIKDQSTGKNYNTNKFALEMFKFFKSLSLDVTKDIKSNTIIFTIK